MSRKYQILIHQADGTNFAKGTLKAVIQDAKDIGVQLYANDNGSSFFTLPVTHPALPLIDPLQQHYTIQRQNDDGVYETIAGGYISDYDATSEEVVISGVDYMTLLDKYYTPLNGPDIGSKPIDEDSTYVQDAIDFDEDSADTGDTVYKIISDIGTNDDDLAKPVIYNSAGERNKIDVAISNSTGAITVSGTVTVLRAMSRNNKVGVGGSSFPATGAPGIKEVGIVIYANPGGAAGILRKTSGFSTNLSNIQIGLGADDVSESFSVTFATTESSSSGTGLTGATRAVLYKGLSYTFSVLPFYKGAFARFVNAKDWTAALTGADDYYTDIDNVTGATNAATQSTGEPTQVTPNTSDPFNNFIATIFGPTSRQSTTTVTSGLKKKALPAMVNEMYPLVIDRTGDYSDSAGTIPKSLLAWNTSVTHINSGSSTTLHPYISFGQSPVELFRQVADQEMGSRGSNPSTDVSKVVFNYFGVSGQSVLGQLTFNHNVSTSVTNTYVYPGAVKSYNVVNKRSTLANSVRILPTTEFLVGTTTDSPSGTKTKGVVKSKRDLGYALPYVEAQAGFINAGAAGNYAQGILNDRGSIEDTRMINVELRNVNPIGATGGPMLGDCVRLVVNRKAVVPGGSDLVTSNYNVGGMQLVYRIDGKEQIFFDLVKPARFKGPAITFEDPNTPKPKDKSTVETPKGVGDELDYWQKPGYRAPTTPTPQGPLAGDGRTRLAIPGTPEAMTGIYVGTSYMYPPSKPRPQTVGLPNPRYPRRDGGRGGT